MPLLLFSFSSSLPSRPVIERYHSFYLIVSVNATECRCSLLFTESFFFAMMKKNLCSKEMRISLDLLINNLPLHLSAARAGNLLSAMVLVTHIPQPLLADCQPVVLCLGRTHLRLPHDFLDLCWMVCRQKNG